MSDAMTKAVEAACVAGWFQDDIDDRVRALMRDCLAAADKARAVTDEEVVAVIRAWLDFKNPTTLQQALRAAGLKVVRA